MRIADRRARSRLIGRRGRPGGRAADGGEPRPVVPEGPQPPVELGRARPGRPATCRPSSGSRLRRSVRARSCTTWPSYSADLTRRTPVRARRAGPTRSRPRGIPSRGRRRSSRCCAPPAAAAGVPAPPGSSMRVDGVLVGHPAQLVARADARRLVQRDAVVDRLAQRLQAVQVVGHVHRRVAASSRRRAGSSTRRGRRPRAAAATRRCAARSGCSSRRSAPSTDRSAALTDRPASAAPGRGARRSRPGRSGARRSRSRRRRRGAIDDRPACRRGRGRRAPARCAATYSRLPPGHRPPLRRVA